MMGPHSKTTWRLNPVTSATLVMECSMFPSQSPSLSNVTSRRHIPSCSKEYELLSIECIRSGTTRQLMTIHKNKTIFTQTCLPSWDGLSSVSEEIWKQSTPKVSQVMSLIRFTGENSYRNLAVVLESSSLSKPWLLVTNQTFSSFSLFWLSIRNFLFRTLEGKTYSRSEFRYQLSS